MAAVKKPARIRQPVIRTGAPLDAEYEDALAHDTAGGLSIKECGWSANHHEPTRRAAPAVAERLRSAERLRLADRPEVADRPGWRVGGGWRPGRGGAG